MDWQMNSRYKPSSVEQLWVGNNKTFQGEYAIGGIPRFILIAPDGTFLYSSMPMPSETAFEVLIRKELGLADET